MVSFEVAVDAAALRGLVRVAGGGALRLPRRDDVVAGAVDDGSGGSEGATEELLEAGD